MSPNRQLIFNHIPKTGGVTLRIILNRVYGEKQVFLIKSTDIASSLHTYRNLSPEDKERYSVVAGHGAELFSPFMDDPYRVTILREPLALFLSQYYYLKNTKDAGFYDEVSRIESVDEYLDYAISNGQDNLLTRYLSNSVHFLADPSIPIPSMQKVGDRLLLTANTSLREYDAVLDLSRFDAGVFYLATQLDWRKIPVYRPANRNKKNPGYAVLSNGTKDRLRDALQWDIALYEEFEKLRIGAGSSLENGNTRYPLFLARQQILLFLSRFIPR